MHRIADYQLLLRLNVTALFFWSPELAGNYDFKEVSMTLKS
jgi:hypothetical protein